MGAESSMLDECDWNDSVTDGPWSVRSGTLSDGHEISVFSCNKGDKKMDNFLRKLTKQLRMVRHPCILMYVNGVEGDEGPNLYTEKATPLETVLPDLSATEICAGLHSVLEALSFLHDKVGSSHNNIHIGSVYVTSDGTWKLSGLEHLTKFNEATSTTLSASRPFRNAETLAPEEQVNKVVPELEFGHARDVYAFGILAESLMDKMADLGDLTKTFELRIQDECLNSDPRQRPKVQSLLGDRLFTTEFLEISTFLKYVTLKSPQERSQFFRDLLPKLLKLPEELVARRLLQGLLSRFVFMDQSAVEHVLPSVLTPCTEAMRLGKVDPSRVTPLFTEVVFQKYAIPKLVKIFTVHEYHIHLLLLRYLSTFIHLIDKEDLELDILPQVLLGLRDSSDQIASLSLRTLADMVLILGRDVVIGGQCKKFFKEGMPKEGVFPPPIPTTNNKLSNLHGVMPKMKLVDMARDSNKTIKPLGDSDLDRKWKEREQRREEMKKRREERKLEHKKNKRSSHKSAKISQSDEDGGHDYNSKHSISEEEIPSDRRRTNSIYSNSNEIEAEESPVLTSDWTEPRKSSTVNTKLKDDWSESRNETAVNEEADDDWSDFENDSDISDAIEKELQSIDLDEKGEICVQSKNPISKSPKSPTRKANSTGKAMKLVPKKTIGDNKTIVDNKHVSDSITLANVDRLKTTTVEHSRTSSPTSVQSSTKTSRTKPNQNLGEEFDIKSLDIKMSAKKEDPFDFFADMAPKIEANAIKPALSASNIDFTTEDISSNLTFGVAEANTEETEDGGGWGDDDW